MPGELLGYTTWLIYALTMKRQEETYRYIYEKVPEFAQERNLDINLSLCVVDFKIANMNVIQLLLPNAQVKGCLFHFSQSLCRKISSLCLTLLYVAMESNAPECASMLLELPFGGCK